MPSFRCSVRQGAMTLLSVESVGTGQQTGICTLCHSNMLMEQLKYYEVSQLPYSRMGLLLLHQHAFCSPVINNNYS